MTEDILARTGLRKAEWNEGPAPVRYLTRGGAEPTLVCLHGLGDSSRTFPEFVATPPLRGQRILAPDCPGFGLSPRQESAAMSLRGLARSVLDLLDGLDVGGFVVLGHSLGGAVAVHLARLAPYRCAGIINLEGNLTRADCSFSDEAVAADAEGRYAEWRDALVPRLIGEAEAGEPGKLRYVESFPLSDPESFLDLSRALVDESTGSRLGHLYTDMEIPRLYLHGGKSSAEETQAFLRRYGLSERLYPDAGHWVHWDARDEAARVSGEFLAAL